MDYSKHLINPENLELHWQMTNAERFALQGLLQRLKPALSIEIGTYKGGSLQVLSSCSGKVISIDINPDVGRQLSGKFNNVEFLAGDSTEILPKLVEQLNRDQSPVGFVLIDGDHSAEGVRRDIEFLLALKPLQRMVVIMHDSFNPVCRQGMRMAAWESSPYVSYVELDFIPGIYHLEAHDTADARTMWGGFGCAVLEPQPRKHNLVIQESQRGLYDAVFEQSCYKRNKRPLVRRILRKLRGNR